MNQESFDMTPKQAERALGRRLDRRRKYMEIDWEVCVRINGNWVPAKSVKFNPNKGPLNE